MQSVWRARVWRSQVAQSLAVEATVTQDELPKWLETSTTGHARI